MGDKTEALMSTTCIFAVQPVLFLLFFLLLLSNYPSGNLFYFLKVTCGMHCLGAAILLRSKQSPLSLDSTFRLTSHASACRCEPQSTKVFLQEDEKNWYCFYGPQFYFTFLCDEASTMVGEKQTYITRATHMKCEIQFKTPKI